MTPTGLDQRTLGAAITDVRRADAEFDHAHAWLEKALYGPMDPIAAEVWTFDEAFQRVLLVNHRWRGWVPPGGKVEPGETPREAASREFLEETGLAVGPLDVPVAVSVRSYRSDWAPTLGLSYAAVVDGSLPLGGESHQPAAWISLDHDWESVFPEDRRRIRAYARQLTRPGGDNPGCSGGRGSASVEGIDRGENCVAHGDQLLCEEQADPDGL